MAVNYKQLYAKKKRFEEELKRLCPKINNMSGIYFWTREENGFKFCYVGQAVKILDRNVAHLNGYDQHIDLSIKKHKLYNKDINPTGWKLDFINCTTDKLDELEQYYIKEYANKSYQLRNVTSGSQSKGKYGLVENKSSKGYRDGLKQGEKNLRKKLNELLDKYLQVTTKIDSRYAQNALEKFNILLQDEEE